MSFFTVGTRIREVEFMICETRIGPRVMRLNRHCYLAKPELFGPCLVAQGHHGSAEETVLLLQEETNSFLKAIEEANKKMRVAEISLEEKDQRIGELDRLIERMEKVTDTASATCPDAIAFPLFPCMSN